MRILISLLVISLFFITSNVSGDWSIADPSIPGNAAYIESIESQGYWNFEWDPSNPISAAMYCCQWEMVYGNQKKYYDAIYGDTSDNSSTSSDSSVETKSYCPACGIDDSFATLEVDPELQELSDELMITKPWLKEGKNQNSDIKPITNNSSGKAIMSFSEPTKI